MSLDPESSSDDSDDENEIPIRLVGALAATFQYRKKEKSAARLRTYLVRASLAPNPRVGTAWQILYGSGIDRSLITVTGFDHGTFRWLLNIFAGWWDSSPIPRSDVATEGRVRLGRRSLDASGALGLCLHYLNSTMPGHALHEIFALTPAVTSRQGFVLCKRSLLTCLLHRYLRHGLQILNYMLRQQPEAMVRWPRGEKFVQYAAMINAKHPRLERVFGFADGLNLPLETSSDAILENSTYNGWTSDHKISNVFTFSPTGRLIHAVVNMPGSFHDAKIAEPLYQKLLDERLTPPGYAIVTDTAFPRTSPEIKKRILAPLKTGDRLPADPREAALRKKDSDEITSARQAAEWGMRSLQGSFGRLKVPLPAEDFTFRRILIENCAFLHNVRVSCVGVDQIRTVYEEVWRGGGRSEYEAFGDMLFGDIRKNDRIRQFYVQLTQM